MTPEEPTPKLHVDTDWKAEAQAEKERLSAAEEVKGESSPGEGSRELPSASFSTLVGMLASQALMGLGTMVDQKSEGVIIDQEGAKFSIDLLGVLDEKTKGNLTEEEANELRQVLAELRARFVQIARLVAEQVAEGKIQPKPGMSTHPDPTAP